AAGDLRLRFALPPTNLFLSAPIRTSTMRASLLLLLAFPAVASAGDALQDARKLWLRGDYAEARERYQALAKDEKTRTAAVIGVSKAYQSVGRYEEAQKALEAALKDLGDNADLLAHYADVLYRRGQWDEASRAAEKAI